MTSPRQLDRLLTAIAREISNLQTVLLKLAKDKTEQLYLVSIPTALPDVGKGIQIKAS